MKINRVAGEQDEYIFINVNESMVKDAVLDLIKEVDMCRCSKCVSDACALVLNQLPPQYVTTQRGMLLSQLPESPVDQRAELTVKVLRALEQVKEFPQHE